MLKPPFATAAAAILITLAGGPMGLGEAHARAIYTGTFDPSGPLYEWSGTHLFGVDEACLETDGWKAVNGQSVYDFSTATQYDACGTVELLDGSLTVKDVPTGGEQTVNLANALEAPVSFGIWGIYVQGGELAGVDTDLIGQIFFDSAPLSSFEWWLRWESGKAPEVAHSERSTVPFYGYTYVPNLLDPVYLSRCDDSGCILATDDPAKDVTFTRQPTQVPEPWSLPLVGAALGALAWVRRRR